MTLPSGAIFFVRSNSNAFERLGTLVTCHETPAPLL
jgi:hypothetical protein